MNNSFKDGNDQKNLNLEYTFKSHQKLNHLKVLEIQNYKIFHKPKEHVIRIEEFELVDSNIFNKNTQKFNS